MCEGRWAGGWGAQRLFLYVREQEKTGPQCKVVPLGQTEDMKYNHDVLTNQKL